MHTRGKRPMTIGREFSRSCNTSDLHFHLYGNCKITLLSDQLATDYRRHGEIADIAYSTEVYFTATTCAIHYRERLRREGSANVKRLIAPE